MRYRRKNGPRLWMSLTLVAVGLAAMTSVAGSAYWGDWFDQHRPNRHSHAVAPKPPTFTGFSSNDIAVNVDSNVNNAAAVTNNSGSPWSVLPHNFGSFWTNLPNTTINQNGTIGVNVNVAQDLQNNFPVLFPRPVHTFPPPRPTRPSRPSRPSHPSKPTPNTGGAPGGAPGDTTGGTGGPGP